VESLRPAFRVYAPLLPDLVAHPVPGEALDDSGLSSWIDGFLDGLGLLEVRLVVDAAFVPLGLACTILSPARIPGLVALQPASDCMQGTNHAVSARTDGGTLISVAAMGECDSQSLTRILLEMADAGRR